MDILRECCAGLDVHRSKVVACVLASQPGKPIAKHMASFGTTAQELAALVAWLARHRVRDVGMEGTGVYWMPIYAALEDAGSFAPIVANARHIKAVPGRKTDIQDAEWIARLIRHGLVRASFVPPRPIQALRTMTRFRRTLVEVQASERRRLIKLLETSDMKLAEVLSDVFGVTGRAILRALIDDDQAPAAMAQLARGLARRKTGPPTLALGGKLRPEQRFILRMQLDRIEQTECEIAQLNTQLDELAAPYEAQISLLVGMPGIERASAIAILAEIGVDMSVFPSAGHLAAWAGVCPGNNESGGKRKPSPARRGNPHLKTTLCNTAIAASRTRGSYFKAKYHSLKARTGGGKAALAIGHKILTCIWNMLSQGKPYKDLGEHCLTHRNKDRIVKRYAKKLSALGFTIIPTTPPPNMATA